MQAAPTPVARDVPSSGAFGNFFSKIASIFEGNSDEIKKELPSSEELKRARAQKIATELFYKLKKAESESNFEQIERSVAQLDLQQGQVLVPISSQRTVLNLSNHPTVENSSFMKIVQGVQACKELNLSYSQVRETDLQPAISTLACRSPHLDTINLEGASTSIPVLKAILATFGYIKSLNVSMLNIKNPYEFVNILIPWVESNAELEVLDCRDLRLNHEFLLKLMNALPMTIRSLGISFIEKPYSEENFCQTMEALSQRCNGKLHTLSIDEGEENSMNDSVITDKSFSYLAQLFPHLIDLDCQLNSRMSARVIKETYVKWRKIETVNLSHTLVNDDDLIEIIRNCKRVKRLNLDSCKNLSDYVFEKIKDNLNRCLWLQSLNIAGYEFEEEGLDRGLEALAPVLSRLKEFEFSWENGFNDNDFIFLAQHLNPELSEFSMKENNTITIEGLAKGFKALQAKCPHIRSLSLHGDIEALVQSNTPLNKVLGGFQKLQEVSLRGTDIDFNVLTSGLQALLENNPEIKLIDLREMPSKPKLEELAKLDPRIGKTILIRLS